MSYIQKYNLNNINLKTTIAVIANINEESIESIINLTNNIPFNFDLFLFVYNKMNIERIKQNIKINSKALNFNLETSFNIRKDLLYLLLKFQSKAKKYKYICNINTNSYKNINYLEEWKKYLYNNLLGDSVIISEILTDFENNEDLGMIFPEKYYKTLFQFGDKLNYIELRYLNSIFTRINPKIRISPDFIDFPEGNMFWAKIKAINYIFFLNANFFFTRKFRLMLEDNLEKIWIFLLKLNGYTYKKIFKHL